MSSADSRPEAVEATPKLPETRAAESVFWQDLRDDLKDPEFREAFVTESERLTADDAPNRIAKSSSDAPEHITENVHENSNLHCESEDAHNREDGRLLADCVNQFKFGV